MNILEWLRNSGYEYTWRIKLGNREPDVIAFKENEVISFEIKKYATELLHAIRQCLFYLHESNKAYIILKDKETKKVTRQQLDTLRKQGIGLLEVNKGVKVLLEAKFFDHDNRKLIEKLKEKSLAKAESLTSEKIKEKIVSVLKDHPEGLPILDIARFVGVHRHAVTKYVRELIGEDTIQIREIGTAKLCFLREKFAERVRDEEVLERLRKRVR